MEIVIIQSLFTLLVGLAIAYFTARFTVANSLKQFHAERWWERKAEAYSTIVESLHHLTNFGGTEFDDFMFSKDSEEMLETRRKKAAEEITKVVDIGSFIICDEAVERLLKLRKDIGKAQKEAQDFSEMMSAEADAVNDCLKTIREIAKRDLGIS